MNSILNRASLNKIIGKPSRTAILIALLDGRLHPASNLAHSAGVTQETASIDLKKMVECEVITVEKHGRHHYYGLQNQEVAAVLESLLSPRPPVEVKPFKQATKNKALRSARTCYNHLAGELGVQITDSLLNKGVIEDRGDSFHVTSKGEKLFEDFQIDLSALKKKRKTYSKKCLDWSERRHHLAGAVGNALLERLLELEWINRTPNSRAITVTEKGEKPFLKTFDFNFKK